MTGSSSFDLESVDHFTAGTVGPTGRRVFYVQARGEGVVVTLRLEKQQVAALAEYLAGILADLPAAAAVAGTGGGDLIEPVVAEWVVRELGVAWDEAADRVVLVAEELLDEAAVEAGVEPATARLRLTRDQVVGFVERARALVAAGRPPCPICGRPLDPEGHVCPRSNGHAAR